MKTTCKYCDSSIKGIDGLCLDHRAAAAKELLKMLRDCASGLDAAADDLKELDRPRAALACATRSDAAWKLVRKIEGA